jgi:integrase
VRYSAQLAISSVLKCLQQSLFRNREQLIILYKTLILVALAAGSRISELAALDRPSITINENKAIIPVRQNQTNNLIL